jgi:predicted Zn-dependent protease
VLGYARIQNFPAAYRLLDVWAADWPESAMPHLLRGRLAFARDSFRSAEEDFLRAEQLSPGNQEVRLELARTYQSTQRPHEAIPLLEDCRRNPRLRTEATLLLAVCLKMTGDTTRVLPLLSELVREQPEHPEALRELGRTHLEAGDAKQAIAALRDAVRLTPYDDEVHYLLAQALQTDGRPDEAQPHFEYTREARSAFRELNELRDVLQRNPSDLAAQVRSGELLLKYSDPQEGVMRLLAVIDRQPSHQPARRLLAEYYAGRAATDPSFQKLADDHRRWLQEEIDAQRAAAGTALPEPSQIPQ